MRFARPALALAVAATVAVTVNPASSAPVAPVANGPDIEEYSPYQGQTTCQSGARPGAAAFRAMVLQAYPGTGNLGITRSCGSGGRSEHKEGRAWDWKVNANDPADRAAVADLFGWLFATDIYGNQHANFRRLGIMYIIWDRQIFTADTRTWRPYRGASPHRDHVHFSFNREGGNQRTSFWDGTVNNIPRPPALTEERLVLQTWEATGVNTRNELKAGQRYRITVQGTYRPRPGVIADAQCAGRTSWERGSAIGDVRLNGVAFPMVPVNPGPGGCDTTRHSYVFEYEAGEDRRLNVALVSDGKYADNRGSLVVHVSALPAVTAPAVTCPQDEPRVAAASSSGSPVLDGPSTVVSFFGCTATVTGTALSSLPVVLQRIEQPLSGIPAVPDLLSGRFTVSYQPLRDGSYFVSSLTGNSQTVRRLIWPVPSRPHDPFPLRDRPVSLTGFGQPSSTVYLRYRLQGDPPGLPRLAGTRTSAQGRWEVRLPANQAYAYRVSRSPQGPFGDLHVKDPR